MLQKRKRKNKYEILKLFSKSFMIYNAVIVLLTLPCTLLIVFNTNPFVILIQLVQLLLMLINAVIIVIRIWTNKGSSTC